MAENKNKIKDLSEDAQTRAISDFAKVYVPYFKNDNLDIIAQDDRNGDVVMINQYILANTVFTPGQMVEKVMENRRQNFINLLAILGQTYSSEGVSQIPWNEWLLQKDSQIKEDKG